MSNAYIFVPEVRILRDELLHELNTLGVLYYVDSNALAPHIVFGTEKIPVLSNNYVGNFV
jgi:hypothetical protein